MIWTTPVNSTFSTDKSYILLEANLPEGPVVIGVAGLGKAAGYAHQFFCYKGKLDLGDFTQGKELLKYSKLFVKLHNAEKNSRWSSSLQSSMPC